VTHSITVRSRTEAIEAARDMHYPIKIKPSFTLRGPTVAESPDEFLQKVDAALRASPAEEVLLESAATS
jgi:carbamoylphosphate synthase large subunit